MFLVYKKGNLYSGVILNVHRADPIKFKPIFNVLKAYLDGSILEDACRFEVLKAEYDSHTYFHNLSHTEFVNNFSHYMDTCHRTGEECLRKANFALFDFDTNKTYIPYRPYTKCTELVYNIHEVKLNEIYYILLGSRHDQEFYDQVTQKNLFINDDPLEPYGHFERERFNVSHQVSLRKFEVGSKPFDMRFCECCYILMDTDDECECSESDICDFRESLIR